jgi:hypothetical protein
MRTLGDKQRKQPQQTKDTPDSPVVSEPNQVFDESVSLG